MIGNDIIDLKLARSQKKTANKRYLEKAFTKQEIETIKNSKDAELKLWTLWSMKETAYKSHQRIFNLPRKLNPLSFQCSLYGEDEAEVIVENQVYQIRIDSNSSFVHSYSGDQPVFNSIYSSTTDTRTKFIDDISSKFELDGDIFLRKNQNGVPSLILKDLQIELPVSLSHHGDFTAFSIALINS